MAKGNHDYEANKKFIEHFGVSETCQASLLKDLAVALDSKGLTDAGLCFRPIKQRVEIVDGDFYQLCNEHAEEAKSG